MTAQMRERLIIDGVETPMAFCPPLPRHPRIVKKMGRMSEQDAPFRSTACWRGYQGTWEIRDGRFYLANLAGGFVFVGPDPLFAEWFSGVLRIPRGKLLHYAHIGFASVFEEEVHIQVERGLVVGTRVIDNRVKRDAPREVASKDPPKLGGAVASWLLRRIFRRV